MKSAEQIGFEESIAWAFAAREWSPQDRRELAELIVDTSYVMGNMGDTPANRLKFFRATIGDWVHARSVYSPPEAPDDTP